MLFRTISGVQCRVATLAATITEFADTPPKGQRAPHVSCAVTAPTGRRAEVAPQISVDQGELRFR